MYKKIDDITYEYNFNKSDSVERLADELLDQMIEKLKVEKGIDIG